MKIIVERDAFAQALSAASRMINKNMAIPILQNVLLRAADQKIAIVGTDLDAQLTAAVPAEHDVDGAITLPAHVLNSLVGGLPTGAQLKIEWDEEEKGARLIAGRSRYKIYSLPASDFPDIAIPKAPVTFTLPGKLLADVFAVVGNTVSTDMNRIYLQGAFLHVAPAFDHAALGKHKKPQLGIVSTDAFELSAVFLPLPEAAKAMPSVIVPDRAIQSIIRLSKDADDVTLHIAEEKIVVDVGDFHFISKVIAATYPKYGNFLPSNNTRQLVVDVEDISSALERLQTLGDGTRVRMNISAEGKITFAMSEHTTGQGEEEIEGEWESREECSYGINSKGLLRVLGKIRTENALLRFGEPNAQNGSVLLNDKAVNGDVDQSRLFLSMLVLA